MVSIKWLNNTTNNTNGVDAPLPTAPEPAVVADNSATTGHEGPTHHGTVGFDTMAPTAEADLAPAPPDIRNLLVPGAEGGALRISSPGLPRFTLALGVPELSPPLALIRGNSS